MQIPVEEEGQQQFLQGHRGLEKEPPTHTSKVRGEPRVSRRRLPKGPLRVSFLVLTSPSPSSILLLFLPRDVNPDLSLLPKGSAQPLLPSPSSVPNRLLLYGLVTPFSYCKSLAVGMGRNRT